MIPPESVKHISITEVAEGLGLHFKQVGRFLQSAYCPSGHESKNGTCFSLNPDSNTFRCYSCNMHGDSIELVRKTLGLSFGKSLKWMAERFGIPDDPDYKPPAYRTEKPAFIPRKWEPKEQEAKPAQTQAWQKKAQSFLSYAQKQLHSREDKIKWLQEERGLTQDTVRRHGLGYNPRDWYADPADFGMTGKKVYLPKGIVIPFFSGTSLIRIRFRKEELKSSGDSRYLILTGSDMRPYVTDTAKPSWMVLESELDAILMCQEAGHLVNVAAMGTASAKPDKDLHENLKTADCVLVSFDDDDAGAKAAWQFWKKEYPNARLWIPLDGKDQNEMRKAGNDLCLWTEAGLPDPEPLYDEWPEDVQTGHALTTFMLIRMKEFNTLVQRVKSDNETVEAYDRILNRISAIEKELEKHRGMIPAGYDDRNGTLKAYDTYRKRNDDFFLV